MNNNNNIRDSYEDFDDYYEYEDEFDFTDDMVDDSLLSNMDNSEKSLVKEAIRISNLEDIYIQDKAFVRGGVLDNSMFGVHIKNRDIDTKVFWNTYDQLKKEI